MYFSTSRTWNRDLFFRVIIRGTSTNGGPIGTDTCLVLRTVHPTSRQDSMYSTTMEKRVTDNRRSQSAERNGREGLDVELEVEIIEDRKKKGDK